MIKIKKELKEFVRPSDHSTYSPSAGDRWMACPFSIKFTEGIPNETSKYAEEGTMAHELCECVFREKKFGIPIPLDMNMRLSQLPDMGVEMSDCAEQFYDVVEAWLNLSDEIGEVIWFGQEKGIPIFPELGCFGTGDFTIVGTKGCAVIDYKHGRGKEVKKGSMQLKLYALGLYRHLENMPQNYKFNAVVFQPRINAIPKVDEYSKHDMAALELMVSASIKESHKDNLEPCEGSHCFWCPAKRTRDPNLKCPLIKQKAVDMANENFDEFFKDMEKPAEGNKEIDTKRDKAMLKILSIYPLLKKMSEDIESEFEYRLSQGEAIEGIVLRDVEGRRRWRTDSVDKMNEEIIQAFPGQIGDATKTVRKVKSITEIEKIVGKKKCDILTVKPIKKKLIVQDSQVQKVLDSFSAFNENINM